MPSGRKFRFHCPSLENSFRILANSPNSNPSNSTGLDSRHMHTPPTRATISVTSRKMVAAVTSSRSSPRSRPLSSSCRCRKCPPPSPRSSAAPARTREKRSSTPATGPSSCGSSATRSRRCNPQSTPLPTFQGSAAPAPIPGRLACSSGIHFLSHPHDLPLALEIEIHRPVVDPVGPVLREHLAGDDAASRPCSPSRSAPSRPRSGCPCS